MAALHATPAPFIIPDVRNNSGWSLGYIYIFIHQNGSQKEKEKNTYIQKYTTNRNGNKNKE